MLFKKNKKTTTDIAILFIYFLQYLVKLLPLKTGKAQAMTLGISSTAALDSSAISVRFWHPSQTTTDSLLTHHFTHPTFTQEKKFSG